MSWTPRALKCGTKQPVPLPTSMTRELPDSPGTDSAITCSACCIDGEIFTEWALNTSGLLKCCACDLLCTMRDSRLPGAVAAELVTCLVVRWGVSTLCALSLSRIGQLCLRELWLA
eukprot:CAMPEP_0119117214 /NCGR_PEP_ID=MMETSP1180-20130426/52715_1 /TAXON_ID=3052 ORGANISM="Chlamydomonas cf sp, Strain CCMP681" /NCGR_SAMPLE_ID=MMETSP1180 /ASSEMBLY_ACC=CAM_ASM_000741 /LENGTH=115 /DNA_ID=CAMNT_0007106447 /DNA_START=1126 /DNA_END=1469 /DNA_ORIENTATION=+